MTSRARQVGIRRGLLLHQVHGAANGCQRIAQLVRQRHQELVLAPVGVAERLFVLQALDQVRRLPRKNVQQPQLARRQLVRLGPVHGEHAQHSAAARHQRRGRDDADPGVVAACGQQACASAHAGARTRLDHLHAGMPRMRDDDRRVDQLLVQRLDVVLVNDLGADPLQQHAVGQVGLELQPALPQRGLHPLAFGEIDDAHQRSAFGTARLQHHHGEKDIDGLPGRCVQKRLALERGPALGQCQQLLGEHRQSLGPHHTRP